MKVVIFAGGFGTRITEESLFKPKPMIEIGDKPILWHIMKMYSHYGFNDFIICLGYKGHVIKEYFLNYYYYNSDITIDLNKNRVEAHYTNGESFKVTLVDTGLYTKTAGRLKRIQKYIGDDDFMLTYGDGVSDVDLKNLLSFHKSHGKIATITSVQLPGRFGGIQFEDNKQGNIVNRFKEKPKGEYWINGGFFVLKPKVFEYLDNNDVDNIMWEDDPLQNITNDGELVAYKHDGFWSCMDVIRDKKELEKMWKENKAKWKIWE